MNYDEITKITTNIIRTGSYKEGDTFQEMYHFWMYVVKVKEDKIVTIEGLPGQGKQKFDKMDLSVYTKEELNRKLRYNNVSDKCWIDFHENNVENCKNLLEKFVEYINESGNIEKIRNTRINLLLC